MQQGCFLIFIDIFIISIPKSQACLDCLVCELVLRFKGALGLSSVRKIILERNSYHTSLTNNEKIKWLHHSKISLLTTKVILQRFFFSNSIYSWCPLISLNNNFCALPISHQQHCTSCFIQHFNIEFDLGQITIYTFYNSKKTYRHL